MYDTERIIFIGGSGRCGTTLMAMLLDIHPDVASLFEVPMFLSMLQHWKSGHKITHKFAEKLFLESEISTDPNSLFNWRMLPDELNMATHRFINRLNEGAAAPEAMYEWIENIHMVQMIRDGSTRIVHKTPALAQFTDELFQLWPDCYFIHMLRNPVSVIASYLDQNFGPQTIQEGIDWYAQRTGAAIRNGRKHPNYLEVRLEDFVQAPALTLDKLQAFVGLELQTRTILQNMTVRKEQVYKRDGQFDPETRSVIYEKVVDRLPEIAHLYPHP